MKTRQAGSANAVMARLGASPEGRAHLVRVASRIVPDDEAEDAAHDAIVQALVAAGSFKQQAMVSTWLHRVAVNAALMLLRKRRRRARRLDAVKQDAGSSAELEGRWSSPSPEHELMRIEDICAVRAAVSQLGTHYRQVAELCFIEERAPHEVATQVGLSPTALRTRALRARRQLREALAPRNEAQAA